MKSSKHLESLLTLELSLARRMNELRHEILAERLKLIKEEFGIEVGSIVKMNGKLYKVAKILSSDFNSLKPYLDVFSKKKDGNWSIKRSTLCGDWVSVEETK